MNLRELILRNLVWKVLSLLLGILVYVFVQARIEGELFLLQRTATENFERTVSVLASAELEGVFKVEPRIVQVTVSGRRDAVMRLSESDIRVYVDLTDVVAATEVRRSVHIQPLPDIARVVILPSAVRVEYLPASSSDGGSSLD
jgi:YbbR domain-containing protein